MAITEEFDYRLGLPDVASFIRPFGGLICLDSSLSDARRGGRYSYLMAAPAILLVASDREVELVARDGRRVKAEAHRALDVARLALLDAEEDAGSESLPPFRGGWAGYIGYEYGARLEGISAAGERSGTAPELLLGWYDWVLAWDHGERRAWAVVRERRPAFESAARLMVGESGRAKAEGGGVRRSPAKVERTLNDLRSALARSARSDEPGHGGAGERVSSRTSRRGAAAAAAADAAGGAATAAGAVEEQGESVPGWPATVRSNFTRESYLRAVEAVRELILEGDIFQANISQRFQMRYKGDVWELYLRLRELNPVPYAAYIEHPEGAVLSASPELFLRVDRFGGAESSPVKGTRARTGDAAADEMLAEELRSSEKDLSENLMIVDLLRNDFSRVCEPGSVHVPRLYMLERWSTVQHLVSTVRGHLREGKNAIDLFRACFPGGSITGAPKIRAMQVIASIERSRRGVYCGSIGYFAADGGALLNIAIRTLTVEKGVVSFAAGGGIVADSDPADEYEETLAKGAGLIAACRSD